MLIGHAVGKGGGFGEAELPVGAAGRGARAGEEPEMVDVCIAGLFLRDAADGGNHQTATGLDERMAQ
jgi:hypothetical protein